jgi:membrane protein DedA with SNARE-associated domain
VNSLHWLDRLLPQLPHYGFALVFLVVFLSDIGFPFPGKVILFGAGLRLGKGRWLSLGTHVNRDSGELSRRELRI